MHYVDVVEYRVPNKRVTIILVEDGKRSMAGWTIDPAVVSIACTAFCFGLCVEMSVDSNEINYLNVRHDLSVHDPDPRNRFWLDINRDLGVDRATVNEISKPGDGSVILGWPHVETLLSDGRFVQDKSGDGLVLPIVMSALTAGAQIKVISTSTAALAYRLDHKLAQPTRKRKQPAASSIANEFV